MTLDDARSALLRLAQPTLSPYKDYKRSFTRCDVACAKWYMHIGAFRGAKGILLLTNQLSFALFDWRDTPPSLLTVVPSWMQNGWELGTWHLTIPPENVNDWYEENGYYDF